MEKSNETCYYCGGKKTSYEHVPPESFFPKGKRNNLIKVPSCDEHNGSKSKNDEYVRLVLLSSNLLEERNDLAEIRDSITRSLLRAAERALGSIKSKDQGGRLYVRMQELRRDFEGSHIYGAKILNNLMNEGLLPRSFLSLAVDDVREEIVGLDNGELRNGSSFAIDIKRISSFFNCMARALYFDRYGKHYSGAVRLYMLTFYGPSASMHEEQFMNMVLPLYDKEQSLGHNKDIFYYDFYDHYQNDNQEIPDGLILNMCLYETFKITAYFYGSGHCKSST